MGNIIPVTKLLFVYNANSGRLNALLDSAHKIVSPSTYDCHLCDITFGVFSEHAVWKKFRERSTTEMVFLHKDEFTKQYASKFAHKFTFPIILEASRDELELFLGSDELKTVENAEELITLLISRGAQ